MPGTRLLLRSVRLFHLYSGVFFAPALLFFAFTGAVQSMNFHETTRGSNYKPPAILVKLAQLHKKETLVLPERKALPQGDNPTASGAPPRQTFDPSHLGDHTNQQKHDRLSQQQSSPAPAVAVPKAAATTLPPPPPQRKPPNTLPLKIFSFWAGVGLFLSTLTGIYMSYTYTRNKIRLTASLLAGLIIPLALLYAQ